MFSLITLIDNECVERKTGTISKVSKLLAVQEMLSNDLEEIRVSMDTNNDEILTLKLKNQQLPLERLGVNEALIVENADLKKKVSALADKFHN